MAEERDENDQTEDPTQRRLDEALKRGDVAKSHEVNTWFIIAASTLILMGFAGSMSMELTKTMRGLIANSYRIPFDGNALTRLFQMISAEVLAAIAIPFLVLALAAVGGNIIQHRLVWSYEQLTPKLSKISPLAGIKRLFSKQALMNFVKGVIKLVLMGTVMFMLLWPERDRLENTLSFEPVTLLSLTHSMSLKLLGAVVAIMAIVAALDFLLQYRQWYERQKMSLRELKDEFKDTEGDPKIKARIRQLRHERMRKRMMAAVPDATVVITNPTHFAVALKYDRGMPAPICVAKGVDAIALKIREVAGEHGVPIVENPPLARVLHATIDVDDEIPAEHYKAVAEVIGYVMKLKGVAPR
ncbi:MAG TPA: flagellar biosynthesis protein FlhB [Xanthobacteraceae bacterium]|nr:flagellar biosynthesis protein FlhB [Xanthobacteraceae bacterium]